MSGAAERDAALELFDTISAPYLERDGVDIGPMFGSEGLRIRGKVFAFVGYRGALVVKLPAPRIDELAASGAAERMVMRDRAMREWALIEQSGADSWRRYVDEAFAFVDSITP